MTINTNTAPINVSDMVAKPMDEDGNFIHEHTRAGIFVKPDPPSEGWGCWLGNDVWLHGFASSFDAWAFVVTTTGIDPSVGVPDKFKAWTKKPQPDSLAESDEIVQLRML